MLYNVVRANMFIKSGGGNRPSETQQPTNWCGAKSYGKPKDNKKAIGFPGSLSSSVGGTKN